MTINITDVSKNKNKIWLSLNTQNKSNNNNNSSIKKLISDTNINNRIDRICINKISESNNS